MLVQYSSYTVAARKKFTLQKFNIGPSAFHIMKSDFDENYVDSSVFEADSKNDFRFFHF